MDAHTDSTSNSALARTALPARLGIGCAAVALLAFLSVVGITQARQAGLLGGIGASGSSPGAAQVFVNNQEIQLRPRPAPDFTLQKISGGKLQLSHLRGHPVILNFWASWCPPCRDEAPALEQAWQKYRGKGIDFVGVDVWDTHGDATRFLCDFKVTYPNVEDPLGDASIAYGLTGTPETVLISSGGMLERKWIGPLPAATLATIVHDALTTTP